MHRIARTTQKAASVLALIYGLYLVKTLLGINISGQYSGHWILKAPLEPVGAVNTKLCREFESTCGSGKTLRKKVRRGINRVKHVVET